MLLGFSGASSATTPAPSPSAQGTGQHHSGRSAAYDDPPVYVVARWVAVHHNAIEAGSAAITVAFSFILAASTIGLWVSTRRLWKSADLEIEESRKSAEQQLRPYVFVRDFTFSRRFLNVGDEPPEYLTVIQLTSLGVLANFANTGQTPAINVTTGVAFKPFPGRIIPSDLPFPDIAPLGDHDIGPHQVSIVENVIDQTSVYDCLSGAQLVFWAFIEYDDRFQGSPRHRTEVCQRLIVSRNDSADGGIDITSLPIRPHGRGNSSDENCERQPTPRPKQ